MPGSFADNPALTVDSPEIKKRLEGLERKAERARNSQAVSGKLEATHAVDKGHQVTQQIITAMTASEFKNL